LEHLANGLCVIHELAGAWNAFDAIPLCLYPQFDVFVDVEVGRVFLDVLNEVFGIHANAEIFSGRGFLAEFHVLVRAEVD
jgi:hypothetical protein